MSHQPERWNGLSLRRQIENAQSTAEDAREIANAANDNTSTDESAPAEDNADAIEAILENIETQ